MRNKNDPENSTSLKFTPHKIVGKLGFQAQNLQPTVYYQFRQVDVAHNRSEVNEARVLGVDTCISCSTLDITSQYQFGMRLLIDLHSLITYIASVFNSRQHP